MTTPKRTRTTTADDDDDDDEDRGRLADMACSARATARYVLELCATALERPSPRTIAEVAQTIAEFGGEIVEMADSAGSDDDDGGADSDPAAQHRVRELLATATRGAREPLRLCTAAAANVSADAVQAACASVEHWVREVRALAGDGDTESESESDDADETESDEEDAPRKRSRTTRSR